MLIIIVQAAVDLLLLKYLMDSFSCFTLFNPIFNKYWNQKLFYNEFNVLDKWKVGRGEENIMWEKIELLMKIRKITQTELADRIGVNRNVISVIKTARIKRPRFDLIEKISEILEVRLDYFKSNIDKKAVEKYLI